MTRAQEIPRRNRDWLCALSAVVFFAGLGAWLFAPFLFGGRILFTNDAVIAGGAVGDSLLRTLMGTWRDDVLVGLPRNVSLNLPLILRRVLGAELWNDAIWPIAAFCSSLAMLWFLRLQRIGWIPATLASVVGFWLGSNFTLVYSGHTMKPFVVLFFVCALGFAHRLAVAQRWPDAVLLGGSAGAMFMHQADMAFLFSLPLGAYVVFEIFTARRWKSPRMFALLALSAAVGLVLAAGPIFNGYRQYAAGVATGSAPEEKWEFMTRSSWPPEDSIAFVAPGFTGWKSTDPTGPYWGRMGRSAADAPVGEKTWNLKIEDYYIGIVPFVFAIAAWMGWRGSRRRFAVWFWSGVALVSLLLAFGKYVPVYRWFYELPGAGSIRNPTKFLQIFQVAMAILTAYGAQALLVGNNDVERRRRLLVLTTNLFLAVGLAAFGAGWWLQQHGMTDLQRLVAEGWGANFAEAIVRLKIRSLFHLALAAGVVAGILSLPRWKGIALALRRFPSIPGLLILGVLVVDVVLLARPFLVAMPRSFIAENPLVAFLASDPARRRTLVLDRKGMHHIWATYLLPFHGLDILNSVVLPRMPLDYDRYLDAMKNAPGRLWRQTGTTRLLATRGDAEALVPRFARPLFSYDILREPDGEFRVEENPEGAYAVLEPVDAATRYSLVAGARRVAPEEALEQLGDPETADFETVFLAPDSDGPELAGHGITGEIETILDEAGNAELRTNAPVPACLRIARRFDPNWKAWIDGEPAKLQRADYLFQALILPAGPHTVTLRYDPPLHFLFLQMSGLALVAVAACFGAVHRLRTRSHQ